MPNKKKATRRKKPQYTEIRFRIANHHAEKLSEMADNLGMSRSRLCRVTCETVSDMEKAGQHGLFGGLESMIEDAVVKALQGMQRGG